MTSVLQPVHIVFNGSAAGSLRRALAENGLSSRVLTLFDDLSFGPLDVELRSEWFHKSFDFFIDGEMDLMGSKLWKKVLSEEVEPIVWFNRNSAREQAGLLAFVANTGGRRFRLIDTFEPSVPPSRKAAFAEQLSTGELASDMVSEILCSGQPMVAGSSLLEEATDSWSRLTSEASLLRILDDDGLLVSAPEDYFDHRLLGLVTHKWTKAARVVGEMMAAYALESHRSIGDLLPALRLCLLAEAGAVEVQGTIGALNEYSVRKSI